MILLNGWVGLGPVAYRYVRLSSGLGALGDMQDAVL